MMKRMLNSLALLTLLALASIPAYAQHTTVTAQVADSNGSLYINCNGEADFVGLNTTPGAGPYLLGGSVFQTTVPIYCDSFARFQVSLSDNSLITPVPSEWRFSICAPAGLSPGGVPPPICFSAVATITGATQDVSAILTAAAALLTPTLIGGTPNEVAFWNPAGNLGGVDGFKFAQSGSGASKTSNLQLGAVGDSQGQLTLCEYTVGCQWLTVQAGGGAGGVFKLPVGATGGTLAASASPPLALDSATGNLTLQTQYTKLRCETGLGDGLNAVAAGTYLQTFCYNDSGVSWTITGIKCYTDNAGTSTLNATDGSANALLTGAITCSTTFVAGSQSSATTIADGGFIKFTFVADGTSKQTTWVVSFTQ